MRVVQLLTQAAGGPADHAVDVAVGLAARGHDSHVVGPESAGTARARAAGVAWHPLRMTTKRDLAGGAAVARRVAALRPDVLHLQDRRAGWLGRLLGRHLDAALVYTLHGVADGLSDLVPGNALAAPRRRRDRWYYLDGERAVTRWSRARVVVPSAAVAGFAVEHVRLDPSRVDIVPNGVDATRFAPSSVRPVTAADEAPTALWLGVLAEVKRVDVLLDATRRVPGLQLLVAGDGPLLPEVRRRVAEAGLADRVSLLGRLDDPAPAFARADFFTLTSAAENCPLALLQAMSCGLPAVATAVGGVPEVVRDGEDGLLCEAGDVAGLTTRLRTMAEDVSGRTRMGASARERILGGFTMDHCLDGLLESYARAAACAR